MKTKTIVALYVVLASCVVAADSFFEKGKSYSIAKMGHYNHQTVEIKDVKDGWILVNFFDGCQYIDSKTNDCWINSNNIDVAKEK
jgi:hypothetical protein